MSKTFYFVNGEPAAVPPPYRPVQPGETKAGGAATAPVAPADPGDPIDVAFWQSAAAANECESIRAYLRRFPNGKFVDLARIAERRLCKAGPEVAIAPSQRPSPSPLAPGLTSGPAAAAAPAPSLVGQPSGAATNVAVAVPPVQPLPAAPAVSPVVAPDIADVGRKLQRELLRVGCAASGIEIDGTWGTASRDALRSFNERTRSIAVVDRPTQEALEAVRGYRERVCPLRCEPGTELRGTACVAIPKALERSRRASRPPARELPLRAQSHVEPGRADPPRSQSYANEPISPNNRNGESWIYVGKQRCKTYEPPGAAPRIICP